MNATEQDTSSSTSTTSATVILEKTMQMMGLDGDSSKDGNISMDNLYPALIQCFTVIICGWVEFSYNFGYARIWKIFQSNVMLKIKS